MNEVQDIDAFTTVAGNPKQFGFSVSYDGEKPIKCVELFINNSPSQILLYFEEISKVEFLSSDGGLLELKLPDPMLSHILYIADKWSTTYFSVDYNNLTKKVSNFVFTYVK